MKLLLENWREYLNEATTGFDLAKTIYYTAFVLDHESHQKLSQMSPDGWKIYSHHSTIIPPTEQKQRLPPSQFFEGCAKVIGIAKNDKVMTAKVDFGEVAIYNKVVGIQHITIATNGEGRPEMSNDFSNEDFTPIEPITVCGKVKEILK